MRFTLSALLAIALAVSANAQDRLEVRCVDDQGQAVVGAEVHVWQRRGLPDGSGDMVQGGPFTTGADGSVATDVLLTYDGGKYWRWVYARVPGRLVGTLTQMRVAAGQPIEAAVVTLSPSRTIRGRVTVPAGFAPERVMVKVATLSELGEGNMPRNHYPRSGIAKYMNLLPERFDCRVAADGTFQFDDFPRRPFVVFITEAEGLAHAQWSTVMMPDREMPDVVELQLVEQASLAGTVLGPDDEPVAGVEVGLRYVDPAAVFKWSCAATTDEQGRFRLDGLPAGEHALALTSAAGMFRPRRLFLDRGKVATEPDLQLESGIDIRGVVVDGDGEPVEGVGMSAVTQRNGGDRLGFARTDVQGRFTMLLPDGPALLYISSAGIDRERSETELELDVSADDAELRALKFVVTRMQ